jgi:preprotein translocase subunit YajC
MFFVLQSSSNPIIGFMPLILVMIVIFFFFIRPQAKKQKEQDAFMGELKKGDKIVTGSGIVGQISKIEEKSIQIMVDQKTYISVVPSAISKEMTDQFYAKEEKK